MSNPYFPVDMSAMRARRRYSEISEGAFELDDFRIQPAQLHHPQGCLCFRIENQGKVVVYATDHEPGDPQSDRTIREVSRNADVLVYDAQYTRAQLEKEKKGWGHSTWEEGVRVCQESGAKQLILFHHDPDSDDRTIDQLQERAQARFPNCRAAFEVMEIVL
jgi:ribonuclease BN (tRNA processing enzyme)